MLPATSLILHSTSPLPPPLSVSRACAEAGVVREDKSIPPRLKRGEEDATFGKMPNSWPPCVFFVWGFITKRQSLPHPTPRSLFSKGYEMKFRGGLG
ncbi:hypothetical protein CDAR_272641 [Caerostris darwini]|uniref:Uncharacterized protein n=1 Tax=Caerostris darwini TaxID=1538125 RepID=A0AAV4V056_9ARAC|nr:hypothetical protein CDAR_272641 [Caerostris darwini]